MTERQTILNVAATIQQMVLQSIRGPASVAALSALRSAELNASSPEGWQELARACNILAGLPR